MSTVPGAPAMAQGITLVLAGSPLICRGVDQLVPVLVETVRYTLLFASSAQATYTLPAWSVVSEVKRFPTEPLGLGGVLTELNVRPVLWPGSTWAFETWTWSPCTQGR